GARAAAALDRRLSAVSRFHDGPDPSFRRLNDSIAFDRRLWPQDVESSSAHARMLATRGIIGESDRDALLAGLDALETELSERRRCTSAITCSPTSGCSIETAGALPSASARLPACRSGRGRWRA